VLPSLISGRRPDVVVAGRETFAWHVPDLCKEQDLPCVLILHGTTTAGIVSGTYPRAEELLEQYRKADLIVVPAKHMARLLERTGHGKVKVIPNSVDVRLFRPGPKSAALRGELAVPEDGVVVAHISNLKRVKRPLDVVGSAERALAENDRLIYVIVGDGACRPAMERECARKGISAYFRFTGWIDHDKVPDYLNLADIVVMPSEFEAQAGAYLETQACARVLLASDIAGAQEVIVDGETGLLHRVGDVDDLASKTLLAASDDTLRAEIGRKAHQAAMAHSHDDGVAAYAAALAEVATNARGSGHPGGASQ
jgi:glycosyltransferase involved in cell wall biosynthesis